MSKLADTANAARKSFFLEENLKILATSKYQNAPIFSVEFETAKEPFSRCSWNEPDQKNGMNTNARYTQ